MRMFCAGKNGWLGNCAFVLGENMVQAQQAMAVPVKFTARTYIPEQEGSRERWLQVLAGFQEDAQLSLCLGAAAISPGLRLLGCDSFAVHLWGASSTGKSAILFITASLYGNPKRLVEQWNQTRNGKETYFEEANGLPSFLDESQESPPEEIEHAVYEFANEKGKGRATLANGEIRRTVSKTWFGILLSTGEARLSEVSTKAGLSGRVIEMMRSPDQQNANAAMAVVQAKNEVLINYGVKGSEVIAYILGHPEWLKGRYHDHFGHFNQQLRASNNLQGRQVPALAAMVSGCDLLRQIGVPLASTEAIIAAAMRLLHEEPPKSTMQQALDFIESLCNSNRGRFHLKSGDNGVAYSEAVETWGRYDLDQRIVHFFPHVLKEKLHRAGFTVSVLGLLKQQGSLLCEENRTTSRISINNQKVRVVSIRL